MFTVMNEGGWLLEIVDEYWNSTCWDESFKNARRKRWMKGSTAIEKEGIESFIGSPSEADND